MIDIFYLVIGVGFVFSLIVQGWLKATYSRWSRVPNSLGLSGATVARHLLDKNGLSDVAVEPQRGRLTDHYDPRDRSIALSERNYLEPSIASAAIAAHETGHALQDRDNYGPMRLRERILPLAQMGAQFGPWAAIGGSMMGSPLLIQLGFALFGAALLFQLLTLPLEFNASRRSRHQLFEMGFNDPRDRKGTRKVLLAAAMTYVASAATAMGQLLVVLLIFGRGMFRKIIPTPGPR